MILGVHVSTEGGLSNAPLNATKLGIRSFQIFTRNQHRWIAKPLDERQVELFIYYCLEFGIEKTIAHDSYLINLCSTDPTALKKSREAFIDEMDRAENLKIDYLVFHPGSHMKAGESKGINLVADSLNHCIGQRLNNQVKLLLETTAGQGTNLGYRFEHLAEIIEHVEHKEKLGVCLDTCHIHAAGYKIQKRMDYENTIEEFDSVIGLEKLLAIHINDSIKGLGSRVDRHAHIGDGDLGLDSFRWFMNDARFTSIPAILETPGSIPEDLKNLAALKNLINS